MIQKIDFCKYIVLYIYGGLYVDIDTICEKSLKIEAWGGPRGSWERSWSHFGSQGRVA